MATHSSILAWRIPWTEKSGRIQFIWSTRVGQDWKDLACIHTKITVTGRFRFRGFCTSRRHQDLGSESVNTRNAQECMSKIFNRKWSSYLAMLRTRKQQPTTSPPWHQLSLAIIYCQMSPRDCGKHCDGIATVWFYMVHTVPWLECISGSWGASVQEGMGRVPQAKKAQGSK